MVLYLTDAVFSLNMVFRVVLCLRYLVNKTFSVVCSYFLPVIHCRAGSFVILGG